MFILVEMELFLLKIIKLNKKHNLQKINLYLQINLKLVKIKHVKKL
jgi:hypothetical protein